MQKLPFITRLANHADLPALLQLEKETWPEHARASLNELKRRIDTFPEGYIIAENKTGIIGSIIACPYAYCSENISNFKSWQHVLDASAQPSTQTQNALYILSGTSKTLRDAHVMFEAGIEAMLHLAKKSNKNYIIAGALLPGYAKYLHKHPSVTAEAYAFTQVRGRYIDPLIERYRQVGFSIPSKAHVIQNYFPDAASCNYSALVVKRL